jgi:hypothetical protein
MGACSNEEEEVDRDLLSPDFRRESRLECLWELFQEGAQPCCRSVWCEVVAAESGLVLTY